VAWIYNFDIGIGLGLKNSLNDALVKKNYKLANELIATAYIFLIAVSILLLLISFLLVFSINLDSIFSMSNIRESEIRTTLLVSVFFTIANFILLLYKQLFFAVNLSGFAAVTTILYQVLVIVFLLVAKCFIEPSLLIVAIIYGVSNLFVGVFFTLYFFKRNDVLKFSFSNYKRNHIKSIGGVGIKFFIIQMCMLMIFTCDNIIISKYLGPEYVTSYSLILKTYQAFI
ncbi:TPA: O159 family O-antigen flippase, partial [Escherichia coli]|nr:O159 family O-antigen flippase [Escherichia coli]